MRTRLQAGEIVASERTEYRLGHRLGQGGMGEVWKALNLEDNVAVAIKFLRVDKEGLRSRFLREVKLLGGLDHPNIVRLLDHGTTVRGQPFLVLELLSGETLSSWLTRYGALPVPTAIEIACLVASALASAHTFGIVHRDLKPANVFLHDEREADGMHAEVKVIDFGIAKDLSTSHQTFRTDVGTVLGTPVHMAPEQLLGKPISYEADVWALGMLIFEMIEGRRMFSGSSKYIFHQVLEASIVPIRWSVEGVPDVLDELVSRCLERSPHKRLASMREIERALRELGESGTISMMPTTTAASREEERQKQTQTPFHAPNTLHPVATTTITDSIEAQTKAINEHYRQVKRQLMLLNIGIGALVTLGFTALVTTRVPALQNLQPNEPPASGIPECPATAPSPILTILGRSRTRSFPMH